MGALLLIYALIIIAIVSLVSGFFILWGFGAALIAFAFSLILFASLLSRGLTNNEQQ